MTVFIAATLIHYVVTESGKEIRLYQYAANILCRKFIRQPSVFQNDRLTLYTNPLSEPPRIITQTNHSVKFQETREKKRAF